MAEDTADWSEIKRRYETGEGTVEAIARHCGVRSRDIYDRVREEDWLRRRGRIAKPVRAREPSPERDEDDAKRTARDALITRMYSAIGRKLEQLEERMQSGEPLTQEESERQTRELGTMISGFEKITEVAADAAKNEAAARRNPVIASADDVERVRRELARRLARVWGKAK